MTREIGGPEDTGRSDRAALVGLTTGGAHRDLAERSLEELGGLAEAVGARVVLQMLQERARPDATTFLGKGKVGTLRGACEELAADLVVFDNELTPAQLRNLEHALDRRVIDRTQLILDIFARRARTREGQLQVELAQLEYLLPRLVGARAALSRLGGGIGTRGPGETKLETDRRRVRQRINALLGQLAEVRRRRSQLRDRRREGTAPSVALVGYTNAGKTTLFNRLSREQAVATNALFVTLDPLVRQVRLPAGQTFLLSDTVGFIDRLPHALVAAFRATLEEVTEADLLLHVVDVSNDEHDRQMEAVQRVLSEVGAASVPALTVLNKIDRLEAGTAEALAARMPGALAISAREGVGLEALLRAITERLSLEMRRVRLEFDESNEQDRARVARAYRVGRVLTHHSDGGRGALEVEVPQRYVDRFAPLRTR
jgi:GTPase